MAFVVGSRTAQGDSIVAVAGLPGGLDCGPFWFWLIASAVNALASIAVATMALVTRRERTCRTVLAPIFANAPLTQGEETT